MTPVKSSARASAKIARGSERTPVPVFGRLLLVVLLAIIALFNFWIAPDELRTVGMFAAPRQPDYSLYALCILDICLAAASVIILLIFEGIKPKYVALIALLALLLIGASAFPFFAAV
jgi:hypothetical protein